MAATLDDGLKAEIQSAYSRWLKARGFRARRGQRDMIATIAKALSRDDGERLCVIEAGTGTGKTVAYCLAAIPIAKARDKHVVITTNTVALQEQVVLRDLPELRDHADLDFTFALAKGRNRYVCLKRLVDRSEARDERQSELLEPPDEQDLEVYERLKRAFDSGEWDGDRDDWPEGIPLKTWTPITNDRAGCAGSRCAHYQECPFFEARRDAATATVVVANYDLLLADLDLGGGVVLPRPEEAIYILDEAHHLADKTRSRFTRSVRLGAARQWLGAVGTCIERLGKQFDDPAEVRRKAEKFGEEAVDMRNLLDNVGTIVEGLLEERPLDRFAQGKVPDALAELAGPLAVATEGINGLLDDLRSYLEDVVAGTRKWPNADQAQSWLPNVSRLAGRGEAAQELFIDYGSQEWEAARWAAQTRDETTLSSVPLDPGDILESVLWSRCYGAVATSATLCALGTFDHFVSNAGLGAGAEVKRIPSPFDFPNIATFAVPSMAADPSNRDAHTREVAALLPGLLSTERSALVLFTSRRQFSEVVDTLPGRLLERCHLQDTASRQQLLADHRAAIDAGEESYLFGLASFAEGVDLPNDYCRHVILAKLPFPVPGEPVDEALAERLEGENGNAFFELSLPQASLKLVQACGRLIRHETDGGRITLLDRRIATKGYGPSLLSALPPYRQEIAR